MLYQEKRISKEGTSLRDYRMWRGYTSAPRSPALVAQPALELLQVHVSLSQFRRMCIVIENRNHKLLSDGRSNMLHKYLTMVLSTRFHWNSC